MGQMEGQLVHKNLGYIELMSFGIIMAVELAKSDGLVDEEKVILEKLRSRFMISFDMTND